MADVPSSAYPKLGHGGKNWVTEAGGLPDYIERIAKHLHYEHGYDTGEAIAIAVHDCRMMCATGHSNFGQVGPKAKEEACQAIAEWEAKKASAHAK